MTSSPELLQVKAAAKQLGIHPNTLRRWEQAGLVTAVHLPSGVRRFPSDEIESVRARMYDPDPAAVRAAATSSKRAAAV